MQITKRKIEFWLQSKEELFTWLDKYVLDKQDVFTRRIFIDQKSSVLFIAHLDTLHKPKLRHMNQDKIFASGLDDRLGCFIAYELAYELEADLLLTDHEESGQTTALYHNCKAYNWIAEFDRAGTDVVTYNLECPEFIEVLKNYWPIGSGSYSDIVDLSTTACCVNVGIGYYKDHSKKSYAICKEIKSQVKKFKQFYKEYKDIAFVRDDISTERLIDITATTRQFVTDDSFCDLCSICDLYVCCESIYGYNICPDCFEIMLSEFCYTN